MLLNSFLILMSERINRSKQKWLTIMILYATKFNFEGFIQTVLAAKAGHNLVKQRQSQRNPVSRETIVVLLEKDNWSNWDICIIMYHITRELWEAISSTNRNDRREQMRKDSNLLVVSFRWTSVLCGMMTSEWNVYMPVSMLDCYLVLQIDINFHKLQKE